ncbi:MAG: ATP-binding protein [Marinilabiliaceae bacterium]|nr:ATP-binding protein [Marinilabiliaceae bacterium]
MENKRLKLPTGTQTFEIIRTDGYLYVDKTKYLIDLIDSGRVYFLSRPRRFGKSLTISTFEALFSGRKEFFKGLYAEEFLNREEFKPSPVIRLDMGGVETYYGIEGIKESIKSKTLLIADELEIEIEKNVSIGDILTNLIVKTAKKYNSKVVFLLDEYDKPYTDFVNDPDMANEVRKLLRGYYSQLKANEKYLSFIFITGISKFTKMGVFSTLNNIVDISLYEEYGNICGLSEEEIINYFPEYIDETAKKLRLSTDDLLKKMKYYYNGFCFDEGGQHRLYNPFSTLNFFFGKSFFNFWIESGTSAMFVEYLKTNKLSVEQFRNFPATDNFLYHSTEIEKAKPESFLFQTGYLSLRKSPENKLVLDYPNTEVLNALSALVSEYIMENQPDDFTYCRNDFLIALERRMVELVISVFNRLLASIPFDDFNKAAQQAVLFNNYNFSVQEWLYRSNILSFLRGCGVVVIAEMHTNFGRPDIVVNYMKKTWVMELKVAYKGESVTDKVEEACKQIIDNNYAKPYPDAICLAMVIDDEVRLITEYKVF